MNTIIILIIVYSIISYLLFKTQETDMSRKSKRKWLNDAYVIGQIQKREVSYIKCNIPLYALLRVVNNQTLDLKTLSEEKRLAIVYIVLNNETTT